MFTLYPESITTLVCK